MILQEAAAAAGRQGRVDVGLELAKRIDDLSTREWVERMVRRAGIVHRARHGDFVGAKRAIADLPSELDKAGALVGSVTTANGLPYSTGRDEWGLALIQLENRDFDGARANAKQAAENLDQIPENSRSSIAAAAIRALARAGDIEASQSLVEKVTSPRLRLQSETEIAAARVRKGNEKDALAFIDALSKDDDKIYALYQIAYAQSKNNNRVGADASLQKAIDLCAKNKNKGMHEIASTQAAIGDVEGAALSATKSRSEVTWSNILYSQVKAGDFAGAIKTLDRLNQWRRGESIALIADALARNGDEARAENWAKEQTDDVYKAYAYAGLAKGLLRVVP
jgi:hypothetical protein